MTREARDPVVLGGLPPPFPPGRESLHASGRNSHGSSPQSPTVVKWTRNGVRGFSKLVTLSSRWREHRDTKSTDSVVRRAIVSGVSVTPHGGVRASEDRFCAHDARWT